MTAPATPRGEEPPSIEERVTPSPLAPAVFDVPRSARAAMLAWLEQAGVPHAWSRDPGSPSVDAWALRDGGVIEVSRITGPDEAQTATGPLMPGLRIVGRAALSLLAAELGLALQDGSRRPALPIDEGRERPRHADGLDGHPDERTEDGDGLREQAELLAECTDARTLRWVAATLVAEQALADPDAAGDARAGAAPGRTDQAEPGTGRRDPGLRRRSPRKEHAPGRTDRDEPGTDRREPGPARVASE